MDETTLNRERIRLHTAAFIQHNCDVEKLIYYLGGPHLGKQPQWQSIINKLKRGVTKEILQELERVYRYGAPRKINATNTEENLLEYYKYGNHESVTKNPDDFLKVLVKDYKQGNTVLFNIRCFAFVPNSHLCPQDIANLDDPWKKSRHISDSSFLVQPESHTINTWASKSTKWPLFFPGSLDRTLIWIYNLRITYPELEILLGDDDVTNAFKWVKNNPSIVAMCGFTSPEHAVLGFCTGQNFGNCFSPSNFEAIAVARQQWAQFLWTHDAKRTMKRAKPYTSQMSIADPISSDPPEKAQMDTLNPGVLNADGSRQAPPFSMQVDDCMYADTKEFILKTAGISIVSLEDIAGKIHPNMKGPFSVEKWNRIYSEYRLLVGHEINSRRMVVIISAIRKKKILLFLFEENWITAGHKKTIRQICSVLGILNSAAEYFPWARAQLFVLENLLRELIRARFIQAKRSPTLRKQIEEKQNRLPPALFHRMKSIEAIDEAAYVYSNHMKVIILKTVTSRICILFKYLTQNEPWECPIGHIVPRIPTWTSYGDACEQCIGLFIESEKVFYILPYTKALKARIDANEIHVNNLEYIALHLAKILVQLLYSLHPERYPPSPCHDAKGDNTPSVGWLNNSSTASTIGQQQISLTAEHTLLSAVKTTGSHVPGDINKFADGLSRPYLFFSKPYPKLWNIPYRTIIKQVLAKHRKLGSWNIFLPSQELISSLSATLCSDATWHRPVMPVSSGQLVPVESILSTGAKSGESTMRYFLS